MILQWVCYPSFSTNIELITSMYFQQIYRFEVDLLKKFAMSLPPEQSSRPKEISSDRYESGWGASPDAAIIKVPTNHNYTTTTISPALIAIVLVLDSALLVVSYYKIFAKLLDGDHFSGGEVGVWTLKRIYKLMLI